MSEPTLEKELKEARRRLLDTGTKSRLIHVNRNNLRANCLNIINERSDDVFEILRISGQKMRFKAMGKDKGGDSDEILLALPDESLAPGDERHKDKFLETPLGPEALERRLLRLTAYAKTAEEEQGLNILYLALGFLRWKENSNSEKIREAPLILLPVELRRSKSSHNLQVRGEDIMTNLSLQERLRQDFGITLPEIDETDEWRPSYYFAQVKEAISGQSSWEIDGDGMQLGFFSFAKLLMFRDLDSSAWPDNSLTSNALLKGLLGKGFEASDPIFNDKDKLDQLLSPSDIIQVVDADASQTKVIEEVRKGSNLVVQGPPGTGKSQTITNIIAVAAHDHKSVLFVAEKMAALSVVHDRLVKAGLRDVCLELHSRRANKKVLVDELKRTLDNSGDVTPPIGNTEELKDKRDTLNEIADFLHKPMPANNESLFQTISELIGFLGANKKPPNIPQDGLERLSLEERMQVYGSIERFTKALSRSKSREQNPYCGTTNMDLQPPDLVRLKDELSEVILAIAKFQTEAGDLAKRLQRDTSFRVAESFALADDMVELASAPKDASERIPVLHSHAGAPRMKESLTDGRNWRDAHQEIVNLFATPAWSADVSQLRFAIARGCSSFWSRWFGGYRRASRDFATLLSGPLPKTPYKRLALIDSLLEVQKRRQRLRSEENWLAQVLGDFWRGESTDFSGLLEVYEWLSKMRSDSGFVGVEEIMIALQEFSDPISSAERLRNVAREVLEKAGEPIQRLGLNLKEAGIGKALETASIDDLQNLFKRMHSSPESYADWVELENSIENMRENKAGAIVEAVLENLLPSTDAIDEFCYACAEARWKNARNSVPELSSLTSLDRHEYVSRFRKLEHERMEETKHLIMNRYRQQVPSGDTGEMGIIRGEIARKRGHKPIRRLMKQAGGAVQHIKPVLLMSPVSVAQFLPPGELRFDLLVIDEASQIRPEDAFGVVARSKQIVVIGDQKQLPPTSFFDRLLDESEEEEEEENAAGALATEMESILSLCEARNIRQRMLEWHYRSRDPSLIRVSNDEFYGHGLILPPSPLEHDENYGLKFRHVAGFYSRGNTRTNKIEAQAIVKAVAQHAKIWPDYSLGVVTFSKSQADMIREIFEYERRQDEILDRFLREGQKEDFFVKNIENVQGDERDVIFISVGYGPQEANGRLASMNFGPINKEGGERRLNVLFSRARTRCEIFASFEPEDMNLTSIKSKGPRVLKKFLEFAKTGKIDERHPTGREAENPFEEDVARFIRSLGYEADPQVGSIGFRIDIGVRHPNRPGQYIVAVECDGASYHSALWARERDRMRQEILESQGWRFHRIWSTDWFQRREREEKRLQEALNEARIAVSDGISISGANAINRETLEDPEQEREQLNTTEHARVPLYRRANVKVSIDCEPHKAPLRQLADLATEIIREEGPLHESEIARRISSAFGKEKAGRRIAEAVSAATRTALKKHPDLLHNGKFLLTVEQKVNPPVRNRSEEEGSLLRAEYLPPMEICAAKNIIFQENGEMSEGDMIRSIARLFGFKQVGKNLRERIAAVLASG